MYQRFTGALYVINIIVQAAFTLLTPAGLMFLLSWLLVDRCGAPTWIYAVTITVGVLAGFISMIRFVISASEGLERLEREREKNNKNTKNNG